MSRIPVVLALVAVATGGGLAAAATVGGGDAQVDPVPLTTIADPTTTAAETTTAPTTSADTATIATTVAGTTNSVSVSVAGSASASSSVSSSVSKNGVTVSCSVSVRSVNGVTTTTKSGDCANSKVSVSTGASTSTKVDLHWLDRLLRHLRLRLTLGRSP